MEKPLKTDPRLKTMADHLMPVFRYGLKMSEKMILPHIPSSISQKRDTLRNISKARAPLCFSPDFFHPAHIRSQCLRDNNTPVRLQIILKECD